MPLKNEDTPHEATNIGLHRNPVRFGVEKHGVGGKHKRKREIGGQASKPPENVRQSSNCNSLLTHGPHSRRIPAILFSHRASVSLHTASSMLRSTPCETSLSSDSRGRTRVSLGARRTPGFDQINSFTSAAAPACHGYGPRRAPILPSRGISRLGRA